MLLGWEPESFLDWSPAGEDRDLRRIAKQAILSEAHKLHAKQRENQALLIGQAFAAAMFGTDGD